MRLTKRQRNAIFETLSMNGLAPESCDLDRYTFGASLAESPSPRPGLRRGLPATQMGIWHVASSSQFRVWEDDDPFDRDARYCADMTVAGANFGNSLPRYWDQLIDSLAAWVREIRYEIDAPDLWTELRTPEVLAVVRNGEASNEPFTLDEQAVISARLDGIKNLVREKFELTSEQLSSIDQRLDEAREASERLGRKDWVMLFLGTMVSVFLTDAVPPSVVQTVLAIVVHGLAHLFGGGGPPPIITT